jgi:hypothetical protein
MNDDDDDWDEKMIEFQSRADEIKKRVEDHASKLEEISDKVSEVLGVILIDEIEEFLREQDSQDDNDE